VLVCDIIILVIPCALLAQRGGHGAGAGHPPAGPSDPAPNSDMREFNRAIALQATSDQAARFQQLTKSTEAARKKARNLIQLAANANKPDSSHYSDLNDAVEEARNHNRQFVGSFSTPQQSGLKPLTKKLDKADADLSKQSKTLTQELGRSQINGKKIADVAGKLDKALAGFQSEQLEIGREMGIQPEEHSQ
jgi:hypothetical protein